MTQLKIVIVGTGNVATHLGKAFLRAGHDVIQVAARSTAKAEKLAGELGSAHTSDLSKIELRADVVLLAVKDDAVEEAAGQIDAGIDAVIAHCSGSLPLNILSRFKKHGVFYPVQTISKGKNTETVSLPVCIEASSPAAEKILRELGRSISEKIAVMNSAQRLKLHLAAVFVNNFVNHLYRLAFDLLKKEHINDDMLKPLILETAMKALNNNPAAVQTGPAARNDERTLELHRKLLQDYPGFAEIYEIMSKGIMEGRSY